MSRHSTQPNGTSATPLSLERRDRLAVVRLDRPPVNAVDGMMVDAIAEVAEELAADAQVGAVVFLGAGRMFSAGADLKAIRSLVAERGADAAGDLVAGMQAAFTAVAGLEVPTVAGIHGAALGGGLELALACDLRVTTDDAKIGLPEVGHGLLPGAGGTQRLTAVAGVATATRMILTGEVIDGSAARERGIVQWTAADAQQSALELGARVAASGRAGREIKRCLALAGTPEGFEREIVATRALYASAEVQARLEAF